MVNNIIAVAFGYLATIVIVFVGLTAAYAIMGADGAFQSGTFEITTPWLIAMFVVNIVAALVGGITCAKASKYSKRAVQFLMLLILILGLLLAFSFMNAPADATLTVREPDIKMSEAMMNAKKPTWILFADPFVGSIGIMLGAMLVCPCRTNKDQQESDQPTEQSVED